VKTLHRQRSGSGLRQSVAILSHNFNCMARTLSHELVDELVRLNTARLGSNELSRLTPRDRVRAVKAALAAHHKGTSRCC
jgi:hypothetical protein